ncbi:hypothetical protein Hanom_Chr17g01560291 [Helianthus anomalus]
MTDLWSFPHIDPYRFNQYHFESNRFDANRLDPYRFDEYCFDSYCFEQYRFESNRFDANRFDANQIPSSPSIVGMNSSINGCDLNFLASTLASRCSISSWSVGSNFTPAGRPIQSC